MYSHLFNAVSPYDGWAGNIDDVPSFKACWNTTCTFSEITRRSPKRSQAAQPPLERRGAKCDLASQMKH